MDVVIGKIVMCINLKFYCLVEVELLIGDFICVCEILGW